MSKIFKTLGSLRLTVILLAFSILLVFFGTLDQVHFGFHETQKRYFESFGVLWNYPQEWAYYKQLSWFSIPLPGGFLIGALLVVNLICAHFRYFKPSWKKSGIALIHFGVVLLIVSGFLTAFMQQESQMAPDENGPPVNYSTDYLHNELVLMTDGSANTTQVTSIPSSLLQPGSTIEIPNSPLQVKVDAYAPNAGVAMSQNLLRHYQDMLTKGGMPAPQRRNIAVAIQGLKDGNALVLNTVGKVVLAKNGKRDLQGFAERMRGVIQEREVTYEQNEANVPAALVTIINHDKPIGSWIVSSGFGGNIPAQSFSANGKSYELNLRFKRTYYPFTLQLKDFHHDLYPGTEIPLNFSSELMLDNPQNGQHRDVLIYMNHPLRYSGYTFFQQSFANENTTSILMVVRNPSWLLPYISVAMIGVGMLVQFLSKLLQSYRRGSRAS